MPALSGGTLTWTIELDYEDREIPLSERAYGLARVPAVRRVTAGGDTNGSPSRGESPGNGCSSRIGSGVREGCPSRNRWRCGSEAFGLCANLRFGDESVDSQAVLPILLQARVNQLKNIALGRTGWLLNSPTSRSVLSNSALRPSHPQHFPQGWKYPRDRISPVVNWDANWDANRDAERDESGRRIPAYSPGSLLPSSMLAKRVELCRNARLNLPIGPLRCLATMISARPLSSGSSCL